METYDYEALQIKGTISRKINESLVVEAGLQININKEPYTVVMRTPGNDFELIRGLLYAEDIYKNEDELSLEVVEAKENGFSIINASITKEKLGKGYLNKRTLLSVSSCGICGKQKLEDIELSGDSLSSTISLSTLDLQQLFIVMHKQQFVFDKTGGSHAASIFDSNNKLLVVREDIGRHNAVDKAVGTLLNQQQLQNASILLVSGRVLFRLALL